MAYESCPQCGEKKHQLQKCKKCGFTRNKATKDQAISHQSNLSKIINNKSQHLSSSVQPSAIPSSSKTTPLQEKDIKFVLCPICRCEVERKALSKHLKIPHNSKRLETNNNDSAPYSEKKIASAVNVANTAKRDKSFSWNWGGGCIWTISGGGGPGTGKKR